MKHYYFLADVERFCCSVVAEVAPPVFAAIVVDAEDSIKSVIMGGCIMVFRAPLVCLVLTRLGWAKLIVVPLFTYSH